MDRDSPYQSATPFLLSVPVDRHTARFHSEALAMPPASQPTKLTTFPFFMKVSGRLIVIVGGGAEAFAKARLLAQSQARIQIFAQELDRDFAVWMIQNDIEHVISQPCVEAFRDAVVIFAATGDERSDQAVAALAQHAGVPVNAVDQPALCDFFTPALINRAPVAVAIGTEGAGPVLAQMIRARIDAMLPPSLGRLADLAGSYRHVVERVVPKGHPRRGFWSKFFNGEPARLIEQGDVNAAETAVDHLLAAPDSQSGHVALVGAGPGAEDLLTLRAQRLLMQADVIVHDALVPQSVVAMGRRDAERIAAGKRKGCHSKSQAEINSLLVALAREGKRVVRLKCGDPLIFGRAGEEMQALRDAGVSYEVVPGVTSAFAAAADFALPLTLRGVSSSIVFTTGHDLRGDVLPDWASLAIGGATVAVYMGRSIAADVAKRLMKAGLAADTAVAMVENASLNDRRMFHGTLADLPSLQARSDLAGPVMTIIGDAVAGADFQKSVSLAERPRAVARA